MTTDDDEAAFLRTIREHPEADLPRLVMADWYEENGQAERAEFIRLQCEKTRLLAAGACAAYAAYAAGVCCRSLSCPLCPLHRRETELCFLGRGFPQYWFAPVDVETYHLAGAEPPHGPACVLRRGFPAEVRAPLAWLIGGECADCAGSPERVLFRGPGATNPYHWQCSRCEGTGRTPGHLPGLVAKWPITRVVVPSRRPMNWNALDTLLAWHDGGHECGEPVNAATLPTAVFRELVGGRIEGGVWRVYESRDAALAALSAAVLQMAKETRALVPGADVECEACWGEGRQDRSNMYGQRWSVVCIHCSGTGRIPATPEAVR